MGVGGELFNERGQFLAYSIEQPWKDNKRFVSCIPVGEYNIEAFNSPHHGQVAVLVNHDLDIYATQQEAEHGGRYSCLIHTANWSHELQGCIALGTGLSWGKDADPNIDYPPNLMITNSHKTVENLLPSLIGNKILIRWRHG